MGALATAFALAGVAVAGYAGWLWANQRALCRRLDALEAALNGERREISRARAA